MKKRIYVLFFIWIPIVIYGQQGINNIWLLGAGWVQPNVLGCTQLDFNNGTLQVSSIPKSLLFAATASTMSDFQGNLLFSTNGIVITNANNDTMPNSINYNPGEFTDMYVNNGLNVAQNCVIVPNPLNNNEYYMFHQSAEFFGWGNGGYPLRLAYSVIDMTLENGKGDLSIKNQTIINDTLENGNLSAVKHANGRDWWLIVPIPVSPYTYKLLIDNTGIHGPYLESMPGVFWSWNGGTGSAIFSSDGTKYARYERYKQLHIWDFDRCEGRFSNHQSVWINPDSINGVLNAGVGFLAFAPNSELLYIFTGDTILQVNAASANVAATRTVVGVASHGLANLAPDGKIYVSGESNKMHIINFPNIQGTACNFVPNGLILPTSNGLSFPHHPNYFLGPLVGSKCDTLTSIKEQEIGYKENVRVYPNPSASILHVRHSSYPIRFELFDALGRKVLQRGIGNEEEEIGIETFANGIYHYKIYSNDATINTGKVIIQH